MGKKSKSKAKLQKPKNVLCGNINCLEMVSVEFYIQYGKCISCYYGLHSYGKTKNQ